MHDCKGSVSRKSMRNALGCIYNMYYGYQNIHFIFIMITKRKIWYMKGVQTFFITNHRNCDFDAMGSEIIIYKTSKTHTVNLNRENDGGFKPEIL